MNKQYLLMVLIVFQYLIQINGGVDRYFKEISSKNNIVLKCSIVKNDVDVVTSKDFTIPLNPLDKRNLISYGKTDKNGNIIYLTIIDEKFIPSDVFGLKHLERLEIRNTCFFPCKRPTIPPEIACLAPSLIELQIHYTNIKYLPKEIGQLKHLQVLILSNTGLRFLPNAIGGLSALNVLILSRNNLKSLPKTMKNLLQLERITLSNNPQLSSVETLNGLPVLDTLYAEECSIKVLPRNLPLLTDLYMSDNNLTTLSGIETLGNETDNEKSMYFNKNSINFIPPQIDQMKNLFELNLNDNKLDYLPSNICNIPTLKHLFIYDNFLNNNQLEKNCMEFQIFNNIF